MGLSKTDLRFLADNARAKMLDTWRSDGAYVASATNKVFTVGSDGNVYHTNTSNGIDEDGNNIGPGAVDPTSNGQSTWSSDFTFGDLTVSDLTVNGTLSLVDLILSGSIRVDTILANDGSQTTPPSIPGLDNRFAKVWANFNGTTGAILRSYNVSSLIDNGVGDYTINFTSAIDISFSSSFSSSGADFRAETGRSSSSVTVSIQNSSLTPVDRARTSLTLFS